jgi:hypothetical protein
MPGMLGRVESLDQSSAIGSISSTATPGIIDAAFNLRSFISAVPFCSLPETCTVDSIVVEPLAGSAFPTAHYRGAIVYETIDEFILRASCAAQAAAGASLSSNGCVGLTTKLTLGYVLSLPSIVDIFMRVTQSAKDESESNTSSGVISTDHIIFESVYDTALLALMQSAILGYEFIVDKKNVDILLSYCDEIASRWKALSGVFSGKPVVFTLSSDLTNVTGALTAIQSIVSSTDAAGSEFLVRLGGNRHLQCSDVITTLFPLENVTFSFDGRLTHAKQKVLLELVFDLAMHRIVLESNAPLFPVSPAAHAGGPDAIGCTGHVCIVANACADIKRVALNEVLMRVFANTVRIFRLPYVS